MFLWPRCDPQAEDYCRIIIQQVSPLNFEMFSKTVNLAAQSRDMAHHTLCFANEDASGKQDMRGLPSLVLNIFLLTFYHYKNLIKKSDVGRFPYGSAVTNVTDIHEDAGSIPGPQSLG